MLDSRAWVLCLRGGRVFDPRRSFDAEADVLLAFYQHSYEGHISSLKKNGIVLYDSDQEEWQFFRHTFLF